MYGKRFVTGDRQKACLFEQKGSYMASIKDSNGQFKTLQLGTNRPVAFKQFFAAASAAGYDMRSVAKEQGVDPEVKLNREQRRKLEKENRHMSNKAKNRKQSERLPESEMSGREAQKKPTRRQTAVTRWSRVFAGDALRSSPVSMSGTRSRKKFMRSRLNALQKSHADMRLIL